LLQIVEVGIEGDAEKIMAVFAEVRSTTPEAGNDIDWPAMVSAFASLAG